MKFKTLKNLLASSFACSLLLASSVHATVIVGTFTGADVGEGLDFSGQFEYAVNARGPGGMTIGDAVFTDDAAAGVTLMAQHEILSWHAANYGASADDDALESVMRSIRWSQSGTDVMTIDLANLIVGNDYSFQMLFAESCCTRGFDIFAEGSMIVDNFAPYTLQGGTNNTSIGAFVRYDFTAADSILNIAFGGSAPFSDNNPIINAFTLENTSSVPEPTTIALLGLGLLALRMRKRA